MSITKKLVWLGTQSLAIGGLLIGTALQASATTINFDSIATPNCGSSTAIDQMPTVFGGFTWDSNLGVECNADYTSNYGNGTGAPSSSNAIYNLAGTTTELITSGSQFQFDGALFSGWTLNNLVDLTDGVTAQSLTVTGFLGGTEVGSQMLTLDGANGTLGLGYLAISGIAGAIDRLQITTPTTAFQPPYGNFWLMDDFQYESISAGPPPSAVPEPASIILLGSGVVGLLARRRRKALSATVRT